MVSLPTFSDPFYSITIALDGADYVFEFRFNQRENTWRFSISLSDGTVLASGVKVVCDMPLLRAYADTRLPPGTLFALSKTQDTTPPGLEDFGEDLRVTLFYSPAGELDA